MNMKRLILAAAMAAGVCSLKAQDLKAKDVPAVIKEALAKRYPEAAKVSWEKEKGNYEANWGGKDGEANSVQYTPSGQFIDIVREIPVKDLPKGVLTYAKKHYKTTKFGDVGRATDANGKVSYEVEIQRKDVIFDENGNFVKEEK
jgi:hypothetical protein